jgi:hypothetical protein
VPLRSIIHLPTFGKPFKANRAPLRDPARNVVEFAIPDGNVRSADCRLAIFSPSRANVWRATQEVRMAQNPLRRLRMGNWKLEISRKSAIIQ